MTAQSRMRTGAMQTALAVSLLATLGASAPSAFAERTASMPNTGEKPNCAARYHARLVSEAAPLARRTQTIADALRSKAVSSDLPGRWLFWDGTGVLARNAYQQRLLATPLINRAANRLCVRQILARGGRIRCMKWKPIPPGYQPSAPKLTVDPTKPTISPAERQFAARLSSIVTRKGSIAAIDRGTAFYHLLQRTTDELTGYTAQPLRSTICTGGLEMINFYRRQLRPLRKKAEQSLALMQSTRTAAHATTAVLLNGIKNSNIASNSEPFDVGAVTRALVKLTMAGTAASVSETQLSGTDNPFALLQKSRTHLTDDHISTMPKARSAKLLKAWRNVEFALYAKRLNKHMTQLNQSFTRALTTIETAHQTECTCSS